MMEAIVEKVQAEDNFILPVGHEMLVFGKVPEIGAASIAEVKPKGKFVKRSGLLMAHTQVEPWSHRVSICL